MSSLWLLFIPKFPMLGVLAAIPLQWWLLSLISLCFLYVYYLVANDFQKVFTEWTFPRPISRELLLHFGNGYRPGLIYTPNPGLIIHCKLQLGDGGSCMSCHYCLQLSHTEPSLCFPISSFIPMHPASFTYHSRNGWKTQLYERTFSEASTSQTFGEILSVILHNNGESQPLVFKGNWQKI